MRPYKVTIFFIDGNTLKIDCDDFILNDVGCYIAIRDRLVIVTIPFSNVKYTTMIKK